MGQQGCSRAGFIAEYVNHPKRTIQIAAIKALGTLRDPKAIPVVESFVAGPEDNPVRKASDESLNALLRAPAGRT